MNAMSSVLAFGAGSMCLGAALTLGLFFAVASRRGEQSGVEGCFSTLICVAAISFAGVFYVLALQWIA